MLINKYQEQGLYPGSEIKTFKANIKYIKKKRLIKTGFQICSVQLSHSQAQIYIARCAKSNSFYWEDRNLWLVSNQVPLF